VYGVKVGTGANTATTLNALNRISKMLDCPAVDRPKSSNIVATEFSVDYTYNSNLGDDRSIPTDPQYAASYVPWASFKKTTQVPQNVIVATDSTDVPQVDDERFRHIADLTTQKRYGGWPHKQKANFLFYDGAVRLISPWAPLPKGVNPYTLALPITDPNVKSNPLLEDWMFRTEQWKRGRPIPSF
jgi:prepilin-type processing-associated H-X9-DG protein